MADVLMHMRLSPGDADMAIYGESRRGGLDAESWTHDGFRMPAGRAAVILALLCGVGIGWVSVTYAADADGLREGHVKTTTGGSENPAGQVIAAPAAWDEGFPIPPGARRNDALGGATTLGPGRNYRLKVYDVDAGLHAMVAFYEHHLPTARRVSEGRETRFGVAGGDLKLTPLGKGTRITLVFGPY